MEGCANVRIQFENYRNFPKEVDLNAMFQMIDKIDTIGPKKKEPTSVVESLWRT
jgi:hypothetical protein